MSLHPPRTSKEFEDALKQCEDEPVHIPGLIQPIGALLAYRSDDGTIAYCSENTADTLGLDPADLLGHKTSDVFDQDILHRLSNAEIEMAGTQNRVFVAQHRMAGKTFDIHAFTSAKCTVLEFEVSDPDQFQAIELLHSVNQLVESLRSADGETDTLQQTTDLLRMLTGYDRVMAYQFDTEFNGTVVAESRRKRLEPMLGLQFPKWDIPAQARAIMAQVPLRFISDVDQTPVRLLASPDTPDPLDITPANLRGVSPIHMQYLRNMGSQATLTLSLVVDNALWGMLSFHHSKPRVPSTRTRQICLAFLPMLQAKMSLMVRESALNIAQSLDDLREKTHLTFTPETSLTETLAQIGRDLFDKLDCHGVALLIDGEVHGFGSHLGAAQITQLSQRAEIAPDKLFATDDLSADMRQGSETTGIPETPGPGTCAGALVHRINGNLTFAVFRKAQKLQVKWAGSPEKRVDTSDGQARLSPRGSFSLFLEEVADRSAPWTTDNTKLFRSLATTMQSAVEKRSASEAYARQQELMVHELNHRVKNILSLIRSISRDARRENTSLQSYGAALEMRINALAAAHDIGLGSSASSTSVLRLLDIEAAPYSDGADRIAITGADCFLHAEFAPIFALVVHELMTNAVKYGGLSAAEGKLTINLSQERGGLVVDWRETGVSNTRKPNRKGFGTTLIENAIPYELGGEATLNFEKDGVHAWFWLPPTVIDLVSIPSENTDMARPIAATGSAAPEGQLDSILLVEDNFMIASEMVMSLEQLDVPSVESVSNVTDALEFIEVQPPDAAILDVNLGSHRQTSAVIAERLHDMGVPFFFVTGYGDLTEIPEAYGNTPVLKKPVGQDKLSEAVQWLRERTKERK